MSSRPTKIVNLKNIPQTLYNTIALNFRFLFFEALGFNLIDNSGCLIYEWVLIFFCSFIVNELLKEHQTSINDIMKSLVLMVDLDRKFARISTVEAVKREMDMLKVSLEMSSGQITDLYYKDEVCGTEKINMNKELVRLNEEILALKAIKDATIDPLEMTRRLNGMLEEVSILRNLKNEILNLKTGVIDPFMKRVENIEKCVLKQEKHLTVVD